MGGRHLVHHYHWCGRHADAGAVGDTDSYANGYSGRYTYAHGYADSNPGWNAFTYSIGNTNSSSGLSKLSHSRAD